MKYVYIDIFINIFFKFWKNNIKFNISNINIEKINNFNEIIKYNKIVMIPIIIKPPIIVLTRK